MSKSNMMHSTSSRKPRSGLVATGLTFTQRRRLDKMGQRLEMQACGGYEAAVAAQKAFLERFTKVRK